VDSLNSLRDCVEEFLEEQSLFVARATLEQRRGFCSRFLGFCELYEVESWAQVDGDFLKLYLEERGELFATSSPTLNTLSADSKNLRVLLGHAFKMGWCLSNLRELVPPHKKYSPLPRALTKKEVKKWMSLCDLSCPEGLQDRAFFELAYGTGLRQGELLALQLQDLDLDEGLLHVRKTKNRRSRYVPIPEVAMSFLERHLENRQKKILISPKNLHFLWISKLRDGPLSKPQMNLRVRNYHKRWTGKSKVTTHAFRHSYATHLLEAGLDVRHLQELLGHQWIRSTQIYLKTSVEDLRESLERARARMDFR